jgi:N-methylhydantoinase A
MLMSVVNIHTVGAGGGSVAWAPCRSALGRGGAEPTVTDANLVLGRVDPDWFAGGRWP